MANVGVFANQYRNGTKIVKEKLEKERDNLDKIYNKIRLELYPGRNKYTVDELNNICEHSVSKYESKYGTLDLLFAISDDEDNLINMVGSNNKTKNN